MQQLKLCIMIESNELLLDKLQQLLKQKQSKVFYAEKLKIPIETVYDLMKELNKKNKPEEEIIEGTTKVNVERGTIESTRETTFDPQTVEQLAKLHKIDLERYKISTYWSKLKGNGKFTSSVLASLKKPDEYTPEDFAKFLKGYTPKPVNIINYSRISDSKTIVDAEVSIADFHLDRRVLAGDTIDQRKEEYNRILDGLLEKLIVSYSVRKLVFVLGNDLFNTDNYHNQTTNLTPQEVSVPWHTAYEEGFELMVGAIAKVATIAEEVVVVLIQGNHDRTKSFYLAHALEVFFGTNKNISFLRENSNTKFVTLGETFIGYHHGNHVKIDGLPLYFATDDKSSGSFGRAKYREVHVGDKHYYMAKDVQGVRIVQIPSMVKPDNFTNDGLYLHVKAGVAFCYHPDKGKCCEFEERL